MRKVRSKTQPEWVVSEIDPDVRYFIKPLSNQERTHVATLSTDGKTVFGGKSFGLLIQVGLLDIEGLLDADGNPYKLKFIKMKLDRNFRVKIVDPDFLELLDPDIYDELGVIISLKSRLNDQQLESIKNSDDDNDDADDEPEMTEAEQADFISDSSTVTCPDAEIVTVTSQDVSTDSVTESGISN